MTKLTKHTILHRQDERGVIVESGVFGPDDDVPEGFGPAQYTRSAEARLPEGQSVQIAQSQLRPSENKVDSRQTVDEIIEQEFTSEVAGELSDADKAAAEARSPAAGTSDADSTVDEALGDQQEGPSDPGGEESSKDESTSRRSSSKK